jgi:hypothetical protein
MDIIANVGTISSQKKEASEFLAYEAECKDLLRRHDRSHCESWLAKKNSSLRFNVPLGQARVWITEVTL